MLVFGIFKWHFIHSLTPVSYKLRNTTANQSCIFSGVTTPIFNLLTLKLPREYPKLQFLMLISQRSGEDQNMRLVNSLIHGMRLCMDTWAINYQSRLVVLGLYSSLEVTRLGYVSRITSAATPGFVGFTTKLTKSSRPGVQIANYAFCKSTGIVIFLIYCLCILCVKVNAISYAYSSFTELIKFQPHRRDARYGDPAAAGIHKQSLKKMTQTVQEIQIT